MTIPRRRQARAILLAAACALGACGPPRSTDDLLFPALRQPAPHAGAPSRCSPAEGSGPAPQWLATAVDAAACTETARQAAALATASPQDLLTAAALCDDEQAIADRLAEGAVLDGRDSCGGTALVAAAAAGNGRAAAALLRAGANPSRASTRDSGSRSPLLAAVIARHRAIATALLDAGADANASTRGHRTALLFAVLDGDAVLVDALLKKRVDACAHDDQGLTALAVADARGERAVLQALRASTRRCPAAKPEPQQHGRKAKNAQRRSRR